MLYHLYETQRSLMEPFTDFAQAASKLFSNPLSPFSQTPMAQRMAAGYDLLYRLGKDYEKPAFDIHTVDVDGIGVVQKFEPIGESHELVIRAPAALAGYIAKKGSVTIDGVSLTVNRVEGRDFSINLIPHTVQVTTLKRLAAGSSVNLEIDLIARYMERMLAWRDENPGTEGNPA